MRRKIICGLFCLLLSLGASPRLRAQGTAFMYQGQLSADGSPATGNYDLRFQVFDAVTNGNAISVPLTNSATAVNNGLFTTTLDFGAGIFTGPDRWLQISVSVSRSNNFNGLSPRQLLTPAPYAIFANASSNLVGNLSATQLSGALPSAQISGSYSGAVAFNNNANNFNGTFTGAFGGNGANLTNLNATQISSGTVADARLSGNVAFLNGNQTFSGANAFTNFGNTFRGSFFGNGLIGWIVVPGTSLQAIIDTGYVLTNSQIVTVTLPASANIGDIIRISGAGASGWKIAQNAGQSVLGNFSSFENSLWTLAGGTPGINWEAVASSADGSRLVAVTSGSSIYSSSDSGVTWALTTTPGTIGWQAVASSADGTKWVAAIFGGTIYTNSGITWRAVSITPSSADWASLASSADGTKLVAVASGDTIYTSANSGSTWTKRTTGLPTTASWQSVASSSDGVHLVAAIFGKQIYTSANSGSTWTKQTSGLPTTANWQAVASSADGSRLAAVVVGGGIYTSSDSGADWTQQTNAPNANWQSIASSADSSKLAAMVNHGAIYVSANWGVTWTQPTNAPVGEDWADITLSSDGSKLAAVAFGNGIYVSQSSPQAATLTGTAGYISGIQGAAVELQYIGNNQWMPVSSAGTIWAN
ncbi:MAG TPA: hypothetical protein VIK59_06370 [Verrucomicrobiae bacterium]